MRSRRWLFPLLALVLVPFAPAAPASAQITAPGAFFPVSPVRILDTRTGNGGIVGKLGPGASVEVPIVGRGGVPVGASAVLLNVTVTDTTAAGFLSVFPDLPLPAVSNLNFTVGDTVANQVLVRVPADGRVRIYNSAGSTNVIFDLAGYYGSGGAGFGPLSPIRIFDSRVSGPKLSQNETRTVQVGGVGGVPAFATAVVLNITVTEPTTAGYVTLYPTGDVPPVASNINFTPGKTIANLATVRLGANGAINLYNYFGSAHVVFDVAGFYSPFTPTTTTALATPTRIMDTRIALGGPGARLGPNEARGLQVTNIAGVPANALAVVVNVTAITPTNPGYLTVYPSGEPLPNASTVNFTAGQVVPNLAEVKVGANGFLLVYNPFGTVDVVVDVVGYVAAVPIA